MHSNTCCVTVQYSSWGHDMKADFNQIGQYLHEVLDIEVTATPWLGADRLPHFLRESYAFAQVTLLGVPCLLAIDIAPVEESPAAVRKHLELVRTNQDAEVVYVRHQVTAYNRRRLIQHKVPFIVPGNQMYLPMLAIDLREHFRRIRLRSTSFSPATQAVVLHVLLDEAKDDLTPKELAGRLGYSTMTMSRVFEELEAADLGLASSSSRGRRLRLTLSRQETWTKAQPFLKSPVTKRLMIRRVELNIGGIRSGLTALAHFSMLAPQKYDTYALSRVQWRLLRSGNKVIQVPATDPDAQEVEVWSYPPELFAQEGFVDPLSLFLSLKEDGDERTHTSLEEMMRGMTTPAT